jgi:hypothetical protein
MRRKPLQPETRSDDALSPETAFLALRVLPGLDFRKEVLQLMFPDGLTTSAEREKEPV